MEDYKKLKKEVSEIISEIKKHRNLSYMEELIIIL